MEVNSLLIRFLGSRLGLGELFTKDVDSVTSFAGDDMRDISFFFGGG